MGFYLDWISFADLTKDEALARLGLADTGKPAEIPPRRGYIGAVTSEGRVVVVTSHYGSLTPDLLAELSQGCELVAARAESNECTASAWGYRDGVRLWSVETPAFDAPRDRLVVQGDPPHALVAVAAQLRAEVADAEEDDEDNVAHAFSALGDLMGAVGGWSPEGDAGADLEFTGAAPLRAGSVAKGASPLGWLQGLFGRRY